MEITIKLDQGTEITINLDKNTRASVRNLLLSWLAKNAMNAALTAINNVVAVLNQLEGERE